MWLPWIGKCMEMNNVSLYIYHFSTVGDFSSEKYSGSAEPSNSWHQQRNLQWGCRWWDSNAQPLSYKPSALSIELNSSKLMLGRSWVYPVGVLHHYIFIVSQLLLTSPLRRAVVLLDTGTPGTSREIYSEDADDGTRTRNLSYKLSALSIELNSSKLMLGRSWVYPVGALHHIFIISQLWLTSHPRSTVVLLDTWTPRKAILRKCLQWSHCKVCRNIWTWSELIKRAG